MAEEVVPLLNDSVRNLAFPYLFWALSVLAGFHQFISTFFLFPLYRRKLVPRKEQPCIFTYRGSSTGGSRKDPERLRIRTTLQAYSDAKRAFKMLYGRNPDMETDDVDIIGELYHLGLMAKLHRTEND